MPHRCALCLVLFFAACGKSGGEEPPASGGSSGNESGGGGARAGGSGGQASGGSDGGGAGAAGNGGAMPADADTPDLMVAPPDASTDEGTVPASDMAPVATSWCPPGPFEAPKPGASQNVCPGFAVNYDWNEGPTWLASQKAFFFSNFVMRAAGPGDMIKFDPATNKCEIFIAGNGCNGLTVDRDGNILAACHTPRALMKYDPVTKKGTVVVDMIEGQKVDSPNDVVAHPNGTIYFSNTTLELAGRPVGYGSALMRVDPAGMVHLIARGSINPLGLAPDQKRLYAMGGYWDLDDAGVPIKKGGAFTLGGDGIAIDCAGNVYIDSGGIISPQNQRIGSYPGGTNSAFGGEDGKTLLVVGGRNMHTVQMNIPGLP